MPDETIPQPTGGAPILSPIVPTKRQGALSEKLNNWHADKKGLKARPSDMLTGALFAARMELRDNPEWLAQAANSLREIIYPFWDRKAKNIDAALKKYGSVKISRALSEEINRVYGLLNDLTHHGCNPRWLTKFNKDFDTFTIADFETLLDDFEKVMFDAMARQLDVHHEADTLNAEMREVLSMDEVGSPEKLGPTI